MNCPVCNSLNLCKKGFRAGKQRYKCKDCGAAFTEGTEYVPAKTYSPLEGIECPNCKSNHIRRDGKLQDGTPRYQCKECKLRFSPKTVYGSKVQWKCPYCGGTLTREGRSKKGMNCYKCAECGKSCTADETGKPIKNDNFSLTNKEVHCPYCGTLNVKKAGYSSRGKQRFYCKDCERAFVQGAQKKEDLNEVIASLLKGANVKKISQSSGYSTEYLRKIMVPNYKVEQITKEQEKVIIKYGYYLKVPVDYMAEYVKCSEHKCKEVLRKYKNRLKSTTLDATEQSPSKTS